MTVARKIAKNTLFVFTSGLISKAIGVAFLVYAVRILGPSDFGIYTLITTIIFFFSFFIDLGITPMAIRELARDREKIKHLFNHILTLRLTLAVLLYPALILAVNLLGYDDRIKVLIYLMATAFILRAFSGSFRILYFSLEKMQIPSVIEVLVSFVSASAGILVLYLGYGLTGLVLVVLSGNALGAFISGIWVRRFVMKYRFSFNRDTWTDLLKQALPFGMMGFLNGINRHMSVILLSKLSGPFPHDIAIGYYSPAEKMAASLLPLVRSLRVASLPTISGNIDKKKVVQKILEKTTQFSLICVSIPLLIAALFFSHDLITFAFGSTFSESSPVLRILGVAFAIQAFSTPAISILSATRDIYKFVPWATFAILITAVSSVILIPIMSFKGVAIAVLLGNLFRAVAVELLLKKIMGIRIIIPSIYVKAIAILFFIALLSFIINSFNLHFFYRIFVVIAGYALCVLIFHRAQIGELRSLLKVGT